MDPNVNLDPMVTCDLHVYAHHLPFSFYLYALYARDALPCSPNPKNIPEQDEGVVVLIAGRQTDPRLRGCHMALYCIAITLYWLQDWEIVTIHKSIFPIRTNPHSEQLI